MEFMQLLCQSQSSVKMETECMSTSLSLMVTEIHSMILKINIIYHKLNGDRNTFYDPKDKYNLSQTAKYYIAGLLKHCKELVAVTNQWVNSYKRLVPGYEAPVYISWARKNRSTLIRVPGYKPGKETSMRRVEFRCPDPACNPYIAFSVMLAAGLEGIKNKYALPEPVREEKKQA